MNIMKKIVSLFLHLGLFLSFSNAQDHFSDCEGAIILCEKADLVVKKFFGTGQEISEVGFSSCSERLKEQNSIWLKWQVEKSGLIEFTITPLKSDDDIDFILYRLDDLILNCTKKSEVRCMASGGNIGGLNDRETQCLGRTGLMRTASDIRESEGCNIGHDNYLSAIDVEQGQNYILYINNYTSNNGFKLEWDGEATFTKPAEIELPMDNETKMSKSVFFKQYSYAFNKKLDWFETPILNGVIGKSNFRHYKNTLIGCMPYSEKLEIISLLNTDIIGDLFPNPTSSNTSVVINAISNKIANIKIYDMLGRLHLTREIIVNTGEQVLELPTDLLISGFYFVQIGIGNSIHTKKLLVTHK